MTLIPVYNNELWLRLIAGWRNEPKTKSQLRTTFDTNYDSQVEWVQRVRNSTDQYFYIVEFEISKDEYNNDKKRSTLMGYCGLDKLHPANRTAEISILIAPRFQGQGTGKQVVSQLLNKAFNEFNLNLIFAETYFGVKFWTKCGFTVDAELRARKYYNGEYHDSTILSISKEEFYAK